jgi:DNA-binding MarR family transcriptional regulator
MPARSVPSPRDPRLRTWRAFLYAHAQVRRQLERELQAEQSMGLAEYELLLVLAYSPGRRQRMGELADAMALSRSGVTRVIDRLEADGLVERLACDTDRRGAWGQLTKAGYERLRSASPTHLRGVACHFLDRIPDGELESMRRTLERVTEQA